MFFFFKYSFHNLPVRVNQSKLVQGIAIKEFSEFSSNQNHVFWIKNSFHNVPCKSVKIGAGNCDERIL